MRNKIEQMPNGLIVNYYFNFSHLNLFDNLINASLQKHNFNYFQFSTFQQTIGKTYCLKFRCINRIIFLKSLEICKVCLDLVL